MPPRRVQACPPPRRTPPNRLKADGGDWLVGLALVLALAPTAAKAEAPFHLTFEGAAIPGTDLRFELDGSYDGGLSVRRGKVRARVPVDLPYPEFLTGVSAKATPTTVTVNAEANCEGPQTFTLSRARLEALLENAAGGSLARGKQWDAAATGFSRALAADPTLSEVATNLAVAQVHARRPTDAVATLARAAEHDPIWVAWRLAADPELSPLAAAPPLAKLYGVPPSHPSHRALDGKHVAFSPSRGLFDWNVSPANMMSDDDAPNDELRIVDLATGDLKARLPYSHVRHGADAAARTLAALGFTELVETRDLDAVFGGTGLKVTFDVDQGTARVSRGGGTIGTARFKKPKGATTPPWVDPWAASIPGAVIVGAAANIGDGCGAGIFPHVLRILVPEGR